MNRHKEILGFCIGQTEGAKFWLSVVTELRNRGLEGVFIFCVDGLVEFPEAINSVYPDSKIQLCIVHLIRNSLKFVPYKDRKSVASDLKKIYTAINEDEALDGLGKFEEKWKSKYPTISDIWQRNWNSIIHFLEYPDGIRKAIYTSNAIESINFSLREILKNKSHFPNDIAIKKIIYLTLNSISKKWSMPIQKWSKN